MRGQLSLLSRAEGRVAHSRPATKMAAFQRKTTGVYRNNNVVLNPVADEEGPNRNGAPVQVSGLAALPPSLSLAPRGKRFSVLPVEASL